jgi:hypothetical protein
MPSLTPLVLYICTYTLLVIMTEAVDSSYHAQLDTIVDPGQDMELEALDTFYPEVSDNVSLPRERLLYSGVMLCGRMYTC